MDTKFIIEQMVLLIPLMVAGGEIEQAKDTIRRMLKNAIEIDKAAVVRYKHFTDELLDLREEAVRLEDADAVHGIDADLADFSVKKKERLSLLKQERADMASLTSAKTSNDLIEILRHLA